MVLSVINGADEIRVTISDKRIWHLIKKASQQTVMGRGHFRPKKKCKQRQEGRGVEGTPKQIHIDMAGTQGPLMWALMEGDR